MNYWSQCLDIKRMIEYTIYIYVSHKHLIKRASYFGYSAWLREHIAFCQGISIYTLMAKLCFAKYGKESVMMQATNGQSLDL